MAAELEEANEKERQQEPPPMSHMVLQAPSHHRKIEEDQEEVEVDVEELVEEEIILNQDGDLFLGDENIIVVDGDTLSAGEEIYGNFLDFNDVING